MTNLDEPVRWNRTIWRGSDHAWQLRRLEENGTPIVPTSARAQVRRRFGGDLWLDMSTDDVTGPRIELDLVDGWLTVVIPEDATDDPEWDDRSVGVWDLEVVVDSMTYRWVMGRADVSQDVTR